MILIDEVDIDAIEVVNVTVLEDKDVSLGVAKSAGRKLFMGFTEKYTIHIEGIEVDGSYAVTRGTLG